MVPEDIAAKFRDDHGYSGRGGVVVVFLGEACGWVDKLRNPEHWLVGAIAVDEEGNKWRAVGRTSSDDSASAWELIRPVRGRPPTGQAKDGAARQRAYRERKAAEGKTSLTFMVDAEVADALALYVQRQNADRADKLLTLGDAVDRIVRDRLLRKR